MLYRRGGDMKRICLSILIMTIATVNTKAFSKDYNKIWTEQRERRQFLTDVTKRLLIDDNKLLKGRCTQGKRLNEMYFISFWSFKTHDSRLRENLNQVMQIVDKLPKDMKSRINTKDELVMIQEAYEAGLLLAMRETCPEVW